MGRSPTGLDASNEELIAICHSPTANIISQNTIGNAVIKISEWVVIKFGAGVTGAGKQSVEREQVE